MEPAFGRSSRMQAPTEARSPTVRVSPHNATVIEAAECAGMGGRLELHSCVWTEIRRSAGAAIEGVVMGERRTVGDVRCVVVDRPPVVPVEPPVVQPPSKAAEEADADAHS